MISCLPQCPIVAESLTRSQQWPTVQAVLRRRPDGTASMKLDESFPQVTQLSDGQTVPKLIEQIKRCEIEWVVQTLDDIWDRLVVQVNQTGDPVLGMTRQSHSEEIRNWEITLGQVSFAGFTTTTEEQLFKPETAPEAV
ncbi:MAG: hypothetical protein JWM11_6837 [Planctomycetaceae bacterium]|nr:hypothetical protein [Planctomycetaceae bacterium]